MLFDTYSIFFRAFYALPPMQSSRGEPTSALYGFAALLLKVMREHHPVELAFAVDAPSSTFRHEMYPAYKGGRDGASDEIATQWVRLGQTLNALGVPIFCVPGFEADDILASLARLLRAEQKPVLVASGDRDLLQSTAYGARVLFLGARGKPPVIYDAPLVQERYGVAPSALPSWVALAGDPSDNLPNVPGIGARTASQLIERYSSVANLLSDLDAIRPPKVRQAIASRREQILMVEELARLRSDLPLEQPYASSVDDAAFERLEGIFSDLEFKSLVSRLDAIRALPRAS